MTTSVLRYVAMCCSIKKIYLYRANIQCVAVCCRALQRAAASCGAWHTHTLTIQTDTTVRTVSPTSSVLQHIAACCSMLQRVAACCTYTLTIQTGTTGRTASPTSDENARYRTFILACDTHRTYNMMM